MTMDRPTSDFSSPSGIWGTVKRWSGENPRLSRVAWFGLAFVVIALVVMVIYPQKAKTHGGLISDGAQPVGVARAVAGDIRVTLNGLGTVTPLATATVRPQVTGVLIKWNTAEGQMVKAGQVLAQIDPRPFQAALDQARGQLARDAATLANNKVDLGRYQALAAQNAISNQQVATQAATVKSAEGVVIADRAAVETARINLGYASIVSPVAGRAGIHLVDIGNIVTSGQSQGIVVVTQLQPMSVLFNIPEDNIAAVMRRLHSGAVLAVEAWDRSQTNKIADGALVSVDSVVDPTTGSVKLRANFDNKNNELFPQEFVNVRLLVDTLHNVVSVPVAAIQRGADGSYVFLVNPDKTVNQRAVKTGIQDGDNIQILTGLKAGDTVVVDGADRLRDGADVSIPAGGKVAPPSSGGASDAARAAKRKEVQAMLGKACAEDVKKLCPGATGQEMRKCLFQNSDDLSTGCQTAMSDMHRQFGGGGRRGGFGGGAP